MVSSPADAQIPWFVTALYVSTGLLLIGLGVPLWQRRIRPNWTYGVRFPSTLADERVWYEINARGGRHLIIIGLAYLLVVAVAWEFGGAWPWTFRLLGPAAFVVLALIVDAVVLAFAAERLSRAYKSATPSG